MEKLIVYNDKDYGWSVQESSGYIHPCQNIYDVMSVIRMVDDRYKPSNTQMHTAACECDPAQVGFTKTLKGDICTCCGNQRR